MSEFSSNFSAKELEKMCLLGGSKQDKTPTFENGFQMEGMDEFFRKSLFFKLFELVNHNFSKNQP